MREWLRNIWWTVSLRGLLIVALGVMFYLDGQKSADYTEGIINGATAFLKIGLVFTLSGLICVFAGIMNRKRSSRWFLLVLTGIPDLILAALVFLNGKDVTVYYAKIIGIWAIVFGLIMLFLAFKTTYARVLLILIALVCVVFGSIVFFNPQFSVFSMNGGIGIFTALLGFMVLSFGVFLRIAGKPGEEQKIQ